MNMRLKQRRLVVSGRKTFVATIEPDFDVVRLKARDVCSNNT